MAEQSLNSPALNSLAVLAGEESVFVEPSICARYAVDGFVPQAVVFTRTAETTAAILRYAADFGLAVIPCGNMTKLPAGNLPRGYDIALCLKEMKQVRQYEPDDLTASVEPGLELGQLQDTLSRRRLWLPLDPPGGASATIGGIVGANAAGPLRLRYGAPRDMVVGMRIAMPSGKIIKTGGRVVKNVAGYDLAKLMIGSYGTLGVIVEINFKLYPMPAHRATWRIQLATLEAAREFRRKILDSPLSPLRMILLDPEAAAMALAGASGFEVWIEFGGSDSVISRSIETVEEISKDLSATVYPLEDSLAEAGWQRISDVSTPGLAQPDQAILKAALPIGAVEEFMKLVPQQAHDSNMSSACFSQNGTGIVYILLLPRERATHDAFGPSLPKGGKGSETANMTEPERADPRGKRTASLIALVNKLREIARAKSGSLVIVRCPSDMKKDIDAWGPPGDDFGLMRKLKEAWDPKGTLSPGRFLGGL